MPPQAGDTVLYLEGGKAYKAFVAQVPTTQYDTHVGEEDEPTLHLLIFDPLAGARALVPKLPIRIEYDVVHVSHEFDAAYVRVHGNYAGNGRWQEALAPTRFMGSASVAESEKPISVATEPAAEPEVTPGSSAPASPLGK